MFGAVLSLETHLHSSVVFYTSVNTFIWQALKLLVENQWIVQGVYKWSQSTMQTSGDHRNVIKAITRRFLVLPTICDQPPATKDQSVGK